MSVELKILDFNFAQLANVALSATSEDVNFPASNIRDPFRSTLWKSDGFFVIDATNNKINFKESGIGPELTATLTSGNFLVSELETEIKTQLEAAGAETYIVSYSVSTGKWTISHAGVFLNILWATGTDTATTVGPTIGFDKTADQTGFTTYTGAAAAIHTFEALLIDLKTAEDIRFFALFFDPIRGIRFSDDAEIRLQANATANFAAPAVDILLSPDNRKKVYVNSFTTDQHFRYWRVKITDPKNNDLRVELGTIILGKPETFTRKPAVGFKFGRADRSKITTNDFGNSYSDELPKFSTLEFKMNILPFTDLKLIEDIYERVGISDPVTIIFDDLGEVFDPNQFLLYAKFKRKLSFDNVVRGLFNNRIQFEETF